MNPIQGIKNIFAKLKQWVGSLVENAPEHPTAPRVDVNLKNIEELENKEFLKWKNDTPGPVDIPGEDIRSVRRDDANAQPLKRYQRAREDIGMPKISDAEALDELVKIQTRKSAAVLNKHTTDLIDEAAKYVEVPPVDPDRTVAVQPVKSITLKEFAQQYSTSNTYRLPLYLTKPGKKLNRAEKKKLKAHQHHENLKLQRGKIPPPEKTQVDVLLEQPMNPDFAEAVMNNNKSISDLIDSLENGTYVEPVRVAAPGVFVPPVSEVMGDNYGATFQWLHPDDQFINFKILTRIVVSDPAFFSKYILRTLDKEDLNAYSIDYLECFAAIEELAPVEDLGAIAIMDQESYCILVAWQNVFGMLILNQDDVIDIKRRSAGFEDPHLTGYYHMTFARFDPEALVRMDLVGRNEYGYADQIPHFKVNFAKFNHEEVQ